MSTASALYTLPPDQMGVALKGAATTYPAPLQQTAEQIPKAVWNALNVPQRRPTNGTAAPPQPQPKSGLSALMDEARIKSFEIPPVDGRPTPVRYRAGPRQPLPALTDAAINAMDEVDLTVWREDLQERFELVRARIMENPEYVGDEFTYNARTNRSWGFQAVLVAEPKLWDLYYPAFRALFDDLNNAEDPVAVMDAFLANPPEPVEGTLWSNMRPEINFARNDTIRAKLREAAPLPEDISTMPQRNQAARVNERLAEKRTAAYNDMVELYNEQKTAIDRKMADVAYVRDLLELKGKIERSLEAKAAQRRQEAAAAEQRRQEATRRRQDSEARGAAIKNVLAPLVVEKKRTSRFWPRLPRFTRRRAAPTNRQALRRPEVLEQNVYTVRGLTRPLPPEYRAPPPARRGVRPSSNRKTRRLLRGADDRTRVERFFNWIRRLTRRRGPRS